MEEIKRMVLSSMLLICQLDIKYYCLVKIEMIASAHPYGRKAFAMRTRDDICGSELLMYQ